MSKKGVPINNEKIAEAIASYALTNSYNATAKECGISDKTVKKIIENNPKKYEEKKELFSERANRIINKSLDLIEDRIDTARESQEELEEIIQMVWDVDKKELNETQKKMIVNKISKMQLNSLSELTTAMGTLYDKRALSLGEPTNNEKMTIVVEVSDD